MDACIKNLKGVKGLVMLLDAGWQLCGVMAAKYTHIVRNYECLDYVMVIVYRHVCMFTM